MFCRSKLLLMSTATIAPFFIHTTAFAKTDEIRIEEIVVTAQKRKQSVQDVPIAISAFDSKFLQENGVPNISQLGGYTPNLDIHRFGSTSNIFIRGAGNTDFATFSTGAVSVYQDDVVLNSSAGNLSQVFDVDRVEILRGPQGTLFGKNTTGGAIRPNFPGWNRKALSVSARAAMVI